MIWTFSDFDAGLCSVADVGQERPVEPAPHRLLVGLDPEHPDTDRLVMRRMFHEDPEKFLGSYGQSGVNKLMDIAVKEDKASILPAVIDNAGWAKLAKEVASMVKDENAAATPVLLLWLLVKHDFKLDFIKDA